jgi:hypothetical protein
LRAVHGSTDARGGAAAEATSLCGLRESGQLLAALKAVVLGARTSTGSGEQSMIAPLT